MQASNLHHIARLAESWFARHQRPLPWRRQYDPYHVWVSEIMLQQTRMEVVLPYFARFIERFPNVSSLAAASDDDVLAAWSGLGYYRRARMLRDGARAVLQRYGGSIPSSVEELMTISGVGRYTAGAIASVAWNRPAPIVDGNVARIMARLFAVEAPVGSPALMREAWRHSEALVNRCSSPRALNQAVMEIGALICRPRNPACDECPLRDHCVGWQTARTSELPLPKTKAAVRSLRIDIYAISDSRGRLLMRREQGPLMTAMYHLPHGDRSLLTGAPLPTESLRLVQTFRHTVTTRRIEFALHRAELANGIRESPDEYAWIHPDSIADVPHPSYVAKALRILARADG